MAITKKVSVSLDTVMNLPKELITHHCDGDVLVVSPRDGNWIVVTEEQFHIFERFRAGQSIGEVLSVVADYNNASRLLKQIYARNFFEKELSINPVDKALFYLTYECNLKCEHCYMHAQRINSRRLSIDEYEMIFGGLKQIGVNEVTFSGGEPLLATDFWEIIRRAKAIGLTPKVFSNGTLWTESDIEKAHLIGVKVQISIDGVDETTCSAVRGAGVFPVAKQVALRLAEIGVEVEIATTPILSNIEAVVQGYPAFVAELREKSKNRLKFKVSLDLMPGRNVPELSLSEKIEYGRKGNILYSIANPDGTKIPFFQEYQRGQGRIVCGLGRLVFSPDGNVHICSRLDFLSSIGNARELDIAQLHKKAKEYVDAVSVDNTVPCRDCSIRHICGGGCRAERYEYISNSTEKFSIHKACSEGHKRALMRMMIQATKECYSFE